MKFARVIGFMIAPLALSLSPLIKAQNPDLTAERKYWEDLASIEQSKARIDKEEALKREAIANAEKAESAARFPAGSTSSPTGAVQGLDKIGLAANVLTIDLAQDVAKSVCSTLERSELLGAAPANRTVVLYNQTIFDQMSASRLLLEQLDWLEGDIQEASKAASARKSEPTTPGTPRVPNRIVPRALATTALVALTGSIRAFADLSSLAKTTVGLANSTLGPDVGQAVFVTALQKSCKDNFVSLEGYIGDFPSGTVKAARERISALYTERDTVLQDRDQLKAGLAKRPPDDREKTQIYINDLTTLLTQTEGFLTALKPFETSAASPLMSALKYKALSERISRHHVLEVKYLTEGLSVTRENMFTGQKLYLSATSVLWYRVMDREGNVKLADVQRRIVTPMFLDVKGKSPKDDFFTPLENVHGRPPSD